METRTFQPFDQLGTTLRTHPKRVAIRGRQPHPGTIGSNSICCRRLTHLRRLPSLCITSQTVHGGGHSRYSIRRAGGFLRLWETVGIRPHKSSICLQIFAIERGVQSMRSSSLAIYELVAIFSRFDWYPEHICRRGKPAAASVPSRAAPSTGSSGSSPALSPNRDISSDLYSPHARCVGSPVLRHGYFGGAGSPNCSTRHTLTSAGIPWQTPSREVRSPTSMMVPRLCYASI